MSGIAAQMNHSTAASTGLVDRLEKPGYVERYHAPEDRRKVMVRISEKGSHVVDRIHQDMVNGITNMLREHLTADEADAWLQIYRKISLFCEKSAPTNMGML